MSKSTIREQELVYQNCKDVFGGPNSLIRRKKRVKEILTLQKKSNHAIKSLGLDKAILIAHELLSQGVFESQKKAKQHLPSLFATPKARKVERQNSELKAAETESQRLDKAAGSEDDERDAIAAQVMHSLPDGPADTLEADSSELKPSDIEQLLMKVPGEPEARLLTLSRTSTTLGPATLPVPSLFPVYLPFRTQHRILTLAQATLEECCFSFGTKWLPDIMNEKSWDCAEAVELNICARLFSEQKSQTLRMDNHAYFTFPDSQAMIGVVTLRHVAVHRERVMAATVKQLVENAVRFAKALHDDIAIEKLEKVYDMLQESIDELRRSKEFLESQLASKLEDIDRRRKELDRLEQEAIESMVNEDARKKEYIGFDLEDTLKEINTTGQSTEPVQSDTLDPLDPADDEYNSAEIDGAVAEDEKGEQLYNASEEQANDPAIADLDDYEKHVHENEAPAIYDSTMEYAQCAQEKQNEAWLENKEAEEEPYHGDSGACPIEDDALVKCDDEVYESNIDELNKAEAEQAYFKEKFTEQACHDLPDYESQPEHYGLEAEDIAPEEYAPPEEALLPEEPSAEERSVEDIFEPQYEYPDPISESPILDEYPQEEIAAEPPYISDVPCPEDEAPLEPVHDEYQIHNHPEHIENRYDLEPPLGEPETAEYTYDDVKQPDALEVVNEDEDNLNVETLEMPEPSADEMCRVDYHDHDKTNGSEDPSTNDTPHRSIFYLSDENDPVVLRDALERIRSRLALVDDQRPSHGGGNNRENGYKHSDEDEKDQVFYDAE